jgi:glycosyltransferase involved in cell wall biosynthesis
MKITIVTGPFYPVPPAPCGAVERLWNDLAVRFAAAGNDVTVLCRHYPGQAKNETIDGVRYVRRLRLSHTRSIYWDLIQDMFYSLRMFLLLPRADVTVTNAFWLPALMRLRKRAGRVVVNVNRWPKGQIKLYRRVDRLAAASSAVRDEIVRQCPEVAPIAKVFLNPIDTAVFVPPLGGRPDSPNCVKTIVYTGRVHPEKGMELLIDGFRELHRTMPQTRLRVIGPWGVTSGGGGDAFKDALEKRAAGAPVEFVGPIYDRAALADALRDADAYTYPSLAEHGEALPVAPLEALATGLTPVVSNLGCFRDYVIEGETGFFFDRNAPDAPARLSAALGRVLQGGPEIEGMSRAAIALAQTFSTDAIANQYLADFAEITTERRSSVSVQPTVGR